MLEEFKTNLSDEEASKLLEEKIGKTWEQLNQAEPLEKQTIINQLLGEQEAQISEMKKIIKDKVSMFIDTDIDSKEVKHVLKELFSNLLEMFEQSVYQHGILCGKGELIVEMMFDEEKNKES